MFNFLHNIILFIYLNGLFFKIVHIFILFIPIENKAVYISTEWLPYTLTMVFTKDKLPGMA